MINNLMKKLCQYKHSRKMRNKTMLEPVIRNDNCWSTTHEMLKCFFEIKKFIDDEDPDLLCNMPSGMKNLV